jgi:hypothetical protein
MRRSIVRLARTLMFGFLGHILSCFVELFLEGFKVDAACVKY